MVINRLKRSKFWTKVWKINLWACARAVAHFEYVAATGDENSYRKLCQFFVDDFGVFALQAQSGRVRCMTNKNRTILWNVACWWRTGPVRLFEHHKPHTTQQTYNRSSRIILIAFAFSRDNEIGRRFNGIVCVHFSFFDEETDTHTHTPDKQWAYTCPSNV